jgi:MFS family permease
LALAAVGFASGATEGLIEVVWITTLQQRVTPGALARVSAYDTVGSFIFMPVGLALAGPAAEAFGVSSVLVFAAVFAVASSLVVVLIPSVREFRRLDEPGYNVA